MGSSYGNVGASSVVDMHLLTFNYWQAQQAHTLLSCQPGGRKDNRTTPGVVKEGQRVGEFELEQNNEVLGKELPTNFPRLG